MKIGGIEISGPNKVTRVFPRESGDDIVIQAIAVRNLEELEDRLPEPMPPVAMGKGREEVKNFNDPNYKAQLMNYQLRRMAWLVLKSLEPSNIEWETVDMDTPSTWLNYKTELEAAGFSHVELNLIGNAVMQANALDEEKLEKARQSFLRGQAVASDTSGQNTQAQSS
jgi:hypothetical protein